MTISILIATYNRAERLAECLDALARQRFTPGDQIIVVDNGSTDRTPEVIAGFARRFAAPLIHLEERRPGKCGALTTALTAATGDVFAFTDDDVLVDSDWLDAIRAAMADPAMALVGGPVAPRWERQPPHWLREVVDGYGRLTAPLALLNYGTTPVALGPRTLLGANLAIRREAFVTAGGFAANLGRSRGTLLSGEDHDLCCRVQAAGYQAVYLPTIGVRHWVPRERMRLRYYLNWFYWHGITHAAIDQAQPARGRRFAGVPLYLVKRAARAACGTAAFAIAGRPGAAIAQAIDIAYAVGYAARCRRHSSSSSPAAPARAGA